MTVAGSRAGNEGRNLIGRSHGHVSAVVVSESMPDGAGAEIGFWVLPDEGCPVLCRSDRKLINPTTF